MTSVSHASSSTTGAETGRGRETPWSEEAEQAVLGAMLLDADATLKAVELLDDATFYRDAHRRIFRTMAKVVERGDVVDPVVLREELMRTGDLYWIQQTAHDSPDPPRRVSPEEANPDPRPRS